MVDPLRASEPKSPSRRRWVKISVILAVVAILVVVLLITLGGHSIGPPPGGH